MENENVYRRDSGVSTGESVPEKRPLFSVRCPKCDRYGTEKLDNYCRTCYEIVNPGMDKKEFMETLFNMTKDYPEVARRALLEVAPIGKDKKPEDVKPPDREIVLNIVSRRLPLGVQGHIVSDKNPMEDAGYALVDEPESYGIEKEYYEIE